MILPRGDLFFSSASLFNIFSQSYLCFFVAAVSLVNQQSVKNRPPPRSGKKNKQTGGGAVIPCTWVLKVTKEFADRVEGIVRSRLPDLEGHETMEVQVSN